MKHLLTVLQSQHRTIVGGARRSPGSHQTVGKTGTFELEEEREKGSGERVSGSCGAEALLRVQRTARTSRSLPQGSEAFLSHDLPEAVDDARVGGLPSPRCHLQARLDDVGGRHEGGCRDTWEMQTNTGRPIRDGFIGVSDRYKSARAKRRQAALPCSSCDHRSRLPAMAPAVRSCRGPSLPCSSAKYVLRWAYAGK